MNEREVKSVCLAVLASANKSYTALRDGKGNPAYLTGKATAYISTFRALSKASGLNPDHYMSILNELEDLLRPFVAEHQDGKKQETKHVLTPTAVKTEVFIDKTMRCEKCRSEKGHAPFCPNDKVTTSKVIDTKA